MGQIKVTSHVLDRFRELHPGATRSDLLRSFRQSFRLSSEEADLCTGHGGRVRSRARDGSLYYLTPCRRGMLVTIKNDTGHEWGPQTVLVTCFRLAHDRTRFYLKRLGTHPWWRESLVLGEGAIKDAFFRFRRMLRQDGSYAFRSPERINHYTPRISEMFDIYELEGLRQAALQFGDPTLLESVRAQLEKCLGPKIAAPTLGQTLPKKPHKLIRLRKEFLQAREFKNASLIESLLGDSLSGDLVFHVPKSLPSSKPTLVEPKEDEVKPKGEPSKKKPLPERKKVLPESVSVPDRVYPLGEILESETFGEFKKGILSLRGDTNSLEELRWQCLCSWQKPVRWFLYVEKMMQGSLQFPRYASPGYIAWLVRNCLELQDLIGASGPQELERILSEESHILSSSSQQIFKIGIRGEVFYVSVGWAFGVWMEDPTEFVLSSVQECPTGEPWMPRGLHILEEVKLRESSPS